MQEQADPKNEDKLDESQAAEEIQQKKSEILIKFFQAKFIVYVDELNTSMKFSRYVTCQTMSHELEQHRIPTLELENYTQQNPSMCSFIDCLMDDRKKKKKHKKRKRRSTGYKVIEGIILLGVVQGQAFLEFQNGCTFKGKVEYGEIKQGDLTYSDGSKYSGKFMNSLPHGPGKLLLPNGTQYITTFKNGAAADSAQITYENGDMYKGPIFRLKKHGLGKLFLKNGDKYIGDFNHGQITGKGTYYMNSRPVASGFWKNGELVAENEQQIY